MVSEEKKKDQMWPREHGTPGLHSYGPQDTIAVIISRRCRIVQSEMEPLLLIGNSELIPHRRPGSPTRIHPAAGLDNHRDFVLVTWRSGLSARSTL